MDYQILDSGKKTFDSLPEAIKYFENIYKGLPPNVIESAIEYCLKNPDIMPEDFESIDLKKIPKPKLPKEIVHEGKVEIFDDPNDPRLKQYEYRDPVSLLEEDEAIELQAKINTELEKQRVKKAEEEAEKKRRALKLKLKDKYYKK